MQKKKYPAQTRGTFEYFRTCTWSRLQERTINGRNAKPDNHRYKVYFDKKIELQMTREAWCEYCDLNKDLINSLLTSGETPSIDRINPDGHYSIENIRIISLKEHRACQTSCRKVRCLNTGEVFISYAAAARACETHHESVRAICRGLSKATNKGFRFEHVE